jgi:hypothetical protein
VGLLRVMNVVLFLLLCHSLEDGQAWLLNLVRVFFSLLEVGVKLPYDVLNKFICQFIVMFDLIEDCCSYRFSHLNHALFTVCTHVRVVRIT